MRNRSMGGGRGADEKLRAAVDRRASIHRRAGLQFERLESRNYLSGMLANANATDSSLAYDASGNLHVAYYNSAAHELYYTEQSSGGSWSTPVEVAPMGADPGDQISMAIGPRGQVDIAFHDTSTLSLKIAQLNGDVWNVTTVDSAGETGLNPELSFLPDSTAVISYFSKKNGQLEVATSRKAGWKISAVGASTAPYSSVALNPQTQTPAVAYENAAGQVYVATIGRAGVSAPRLMGSTPAKAANLSLAFDATGEPAVTFLNTGGGVLKLARATSSTAVTVSNVAQVPKGNDPQASLSFNTPNGLPQILYDNISLNGLFVTKYHAGTSQWMGKVLQYGAATNANSVALGPGATVAYAAISVGSGSALAIDTTVSTPAPPSNLAAVAASVDQINVTWTDTAGDAMGFVIARSTDGVNFTPVATLGANASNYPDSGLGAGTQYYYQVSAVGSDGSQSLGVTAPNLTGATDVVATATTLQAGSIGGYVYNDKLDAGALGPNVHTTTALPGGSISAIDAQLSIPGIGTLVTLTGTLADGTVLAPQTINTALTGGQYNFGNLNAGTYTVTVTRPAGYLPGMENSSGVVANIVLTTGQNLTENFGEISPAAVSGFVYNDANDRGFMQSGESGFAGANISLSGTNDLGNTVQMTTATAADGSYSFASLRPGTYTVLETPPAGVLAGKENSDGSSGSFNVIVGTNRPDVNFGELLPASVSGFVYDDTNDDGMMQAGESGIAGVSLTLSGTDDLGDSVNTTLSTASDGSYSFSGLRPGNYVVTETPPAGALAGKQNSSGNSGSITVTDGAAQTGVNFGELTPASISGFVYSDVNDDGIMESGESGIAGVSITLGGTNDLGSAVSLATVTASDGSYNFSNLRPGAYTTVITQPAGLLPGTQNSSGNSGPITVGDGSAQTGVNFGELSPGSISGLVYVDANDDGVMQAGEAGVAGVTVTLNGTDLQGDAVLLTAVTGADGSYSFASLQPGTYTVVKTPPAGLLEGKQDSTDSSGSITLAYGAAAANVNFGELEPASISGFVYNDANDDGTMETGEAGIANVTISLSGTDDLGHAVGLARMTAVDGSYSFTNLRPGTYMVTETQPTGFLAGKQNSTGTVSAIVVNGGASQSGVNFGELSAASISGFVYNDANDDGIKQSGESGIAGVTMTLSGTDDLGHAVNVALLTASDGSYSFTNLRPGSYTVTETQPAGLLEGKQNSSDNSGTLTLANGTAQTGVNFGELSPAVISGFVYNDASDDGIKQSGESGIAGVTISLSGTDDLGHVVSANQLTASDGSYSFANLRPGTYAITETPPAGFLAGKQNSTGSSGSLSIAAGTNQTGVSFAELSPAVISGFVYNDANDDGVKQSGESGISAVTLSLSGTDDLGHAVSITQATASDGSYSFTRLRPGTYTVTETAPAGLLAGKQNATGNSGSIAITGGANQTAVSFGELSPASISGFVYNDANDDGVKQSGEAGIAAVTISLSGTNDLGHPVSLAQATASDGSYSFTNLRPGTYTVVETQPPALLAGKQNATGTVASIAVADGAAQTGVSFAELSLGSVSGFVYSDANDDGVKQSGEAGISGATVQLAGIDDLGNLVLIRDTTPSGGSYSFTNLRPGTYTVTDTPPAGWLAGKQNSTGTASTFALSDGQVTSSLNFGELQPANISGYVYNDASDDGVKQSGEAGISAVTIALSGTDDLGHAVSASKATASDGSYNFTNLRPGTYTITETAPSGYLAGKQNSTGNSGSISLAAGANQTGISFAELSPATVGGIVYNDANDDGTKQSGESGIAGVTIALTGTDDLGHAVSVSQVTASNGSYSFTNLRPGTYNVSAGLASGMIAGKQNTSGSSGSLALNSGGSTSGINFGEISGASLSGFVYNDANDDGVMDSGDSGLAGQTVTLTGTNDLGGQVNATTQTASDGSYSLTGLRPGTYMLTDSQASGYVQGQSNVGSQASGTAAVGSISGIVIGSGINGQGDNFAEVSTTSGPQYLLTPSEIANAQAEAAANTPQWQAFEAGLNGQLNTVMSDASYGVYDGSQLTYIPSYALGYLVLKNSDPTLANEYADKALAIMSSGLTDLLGPFNGAGRVVIGVGNGSTTQFTLPNSNVNVSTLQVYTNPTYVVAVTRGATPNTLDQTSNYLSVPISISNTPGGPANYTEDVDWQENGNSPAGAIDWSLGSTNQPAPRSTYYVTYSSFLASQASGYTVNGNKVVFANAPSANTAVFAEYLYGQTGQPDGGAYQESTDNLGGFNAISEGSIGYDGRNLTSMAMGLDWLWGYQNFSSTLRTNLSNMLVCWANWYPANGYYQNSPESNYGATDFGFEAATALALQGRIGAATAAQLKSYVLNWYNTNLLPELALPSANTPPGTSTLYGGHWDEGWTYAESAIAALLDSGAALASAGWATDTAMRTWADQTTLELFSEQPTQTTIYDGGQNYNWPVSFPYTDDTASLYGMVTSTTLQAYLKYSIDNGYSVSNNDWINMVFLVDSAPSVNWAEQLPLDNLSAGQGFVTARQDWSFNSTWLSFQVGNPVQADHQTYAAGQFSLDNGADALIILPASASVNWPTYTASMDNLVVVNDNGAGSEIFPGNQAYWYGPQGVAMTNYESTSTYMYAAGNYTNAYGNPQSNPYVSAATNLTRQVFYLPGSDYVFVYDIADTAQASYEKQLQWWFINNPSVSSNGSWSTGLEHVDGVIETLQGAPITQRANVNLTGTDMNGNPVNVNITSSANGDFSFSNLPPLKSYSLWDQYVPYDVPVVTSQGSSQLFGQEYSTTPLSIASTTVQDGNSTFGELTVNPASPTKDVNYLTVMQVANGLSAMPAASTHIVSGDGQLEGSDVGSDVVLFAANGSVTGGTSYSVTAVAGTTLTHYVVGLTPGATYTLAGANQASTVASANGVLTFTSTGTGAGQTISLQPPIGSTGSAPISSQAFQPPNGSPSGGSSGSEMLLGSGENILGGVSIGSASLLN